MGEIHQLVIQHGREQARNLAESKTDRRLVDIAADILSQETNSLGFTYSGFCLTALPHRRIPDDSKWERRGHKLILVVHPGTLRINGVTLDFGVPYGSRARMILLYLQTRALQTDNPEVELGRSMHDWLDRMGIPVGGRTYTDVREQANRISACNLTFFWEDGATEGFEKDSIVKGGLRLHGASDDPRQPSLWTETVRLSDSFFKALKAHPVPLWEPALRQISNKSMSIDLYIWLAYRLQSLRKPTPLSWTSVYHQFGAGFSSQRKFKQKFKENLGFALAVYPEAKVEVAEDGLILFPSRPAVDRVTLVALPRR